MNKQGKVEAQTKAKEMLISGATIDDVMKTTGLKLKDIKRVNSIV